MHFKRVFVRAGLLCLCLLLIFPACKKKRAFKDENGQSAEDVRSVQGQNDEAIKDVNFAIMEQALLRGRGTAVESPTGTELCGVQLDTTMLYQGIARLNYLGTNCSGLRKTGSIVITITNYPISKWKNRGTVLKMDFMAYKVILPNGKSVQFDGTAYIKNESGNTWYEMRYLNAGSLIQTQTAENIKITYDANATALFNFSRRLTFSYSAGVVSCSVEGLGSSNGYKNLDNWGQTRNGDNFTTEVTNPLIWKSSCGSSYPVSGTLNLAIEGKDFDLESEFGVDESGEPAGDGTCPYGWKVSWSYKKKQNSRVIRYN